MRNEREESPLWKHCNLAHNGEKQDFSMEVVGSFQSCLERQINEAVRINIKEKTRVGWQLETDVEVREVLVEGNRGMK